MRACVQCGKATVRQLRPRGLWVVECDCGSVSSVSQSAAINKWETRLDHIIADLDWEEELRKKRAEQQGTC